MNESVETRQKSPISPDAVNISKNSEKRFCNGILAFCNGIEEAEGDRSFVVANLRKGGTPFSGSATCTCNGVVFENENETEGEYLIAPFGDHPHGEFIQRIDRQAAERLERNMRGVWARIKNAVVGNACPVYYSHPDNEDRLETPREPDKTPYGRVRSLIIRDDGIWAKIQWLVGFKDLPKRLQLSPRWNADEIAENIYSPKRLISVGLTRAPRIKETSFVNEADLNNQQQKDIEMDKEVLKLLGYSDEEIQKIIEKADDAPTDINDRLKKALTDKTTAEAERDTAKETAEKSAKSLEETKIALANSQNARAELVAEKAVRLGKITEAQKANTVQILANSEDFAEAEKNLMGGKDVIKTQSKTGDIEKEEKAAQKALSDLRSEVEKFVKEKTAEYGGGVDAYDRAWNEAKKHDKFKKLFE